MKKILLAASAVLFCTGVASAADLGARPYAKAPIAPVFSWTGFYVGVNAGGVFDNSTSVTPSGLFPTNYPIASGATFGKTGFTGGGQIGYNYQFSPNWVVGIEADFNYVDRGPKEAVFTGLPSTPFGFGSSPNTLVVSPGHGDFFGTVRGRFGYSWDRTLLYVTGGIAYQSGSGPSASFWNAAGAKYARFTDKSDPGYVVGGGLEYAWTNDWTVRAEYLYVDFGGSRTLTDTGTPVGTGYSYTSSGDHFSVARVGLNYKFGGL